MPCSATRCGNTAPWPTILLRYSPRGGRNHRAPSATESGRVEKTRKGRFTGATHLSLLLKVVRLTLLVPPKRLVFNDKAMIVDIGAMPHHHRAI
jgi:hypothetical protein